MMNTFPRRRSSTRAWAVTTALALGASSLVVGLVSPAAAADPCAVGGNPIVCENSKPGTDPSVWDISGAGDESIQGFATDISVNVGSTIGFKVDTVATGYTIDIYRTGWYGGDGARLIDSVTPSATLPQVQPECLSDLATELYDCGNWGVSASWAVPSTAVSGVYVALLTRTDTTAGESSHITFVVRNEASHSDLVFQTSDTTWQAYNTYGGSDFYQGAANGRAYKISYNRPFATRAGVTSRDFYFSSEYAAVRFLERNGYDVSYISGVDTDRFGSLLTNHGTFLSVGHDEYWSAGQRANVEAARDAGVNLVFLSGNEMYWKTRYESSADGTATSYRTLVSYKETWSNAKIDPSTEWTGTWRDPRFAPTSAGAGRPENGLTGTLYMSNHSDLAVTVSADEGKLRLWRNTTLTSLAAGTTAALAPHTIGYESNEDLDNGSRPAGLIRLSTTTGAVPQYLQDFGNLVVPGTTTHHLTQYRAPSGALVFSAGSIQWAWGLDETHDGDGAAADARMQQATVNLLADTGAQPGTLMSGLASAARSTDTTGPTATLTAPAAGADIANGTTVTVTGTASDLGGGRVAGVEVSTDGGSTWHPATGTTAWTYTYVQHGLGSASLRARAIDDSANIGAVSATRTLTVACPCSVLGSETPAVASADDVSGVELGLRFTPEVDGFVSGVRFYKGAANTGTHTGSLWSATGTRLANVTFTGETAGGWQAATFSTAVPVVAGTAYVVSYTAPNGGYAMTPEAFAPAGRASTPLAVAGGFGAAPAGLFALPGRFPADSYGNANYWVDVDFTTTDLTPLTASGHLPLDGATSVPTGATVSAVLSKPAAAGTAQITLASPSGNVAGTSTFVAATRTVVFTATSPLVASTRYVATLSAVDATGAPLTSGTTWSFTTAAPDQEPGGQTVSFYDDSAVPGVLEVADTVPVTLGVRFASTADGTVTGVRFYKGPGNTGSHVGALWSAGGTLLASATFSEESASGWQTVTFASPVTIAKNTDYIASYRTTVGRYSADLGAFSGAGLQREPLVTSSTSGAFSYADAFPSEPSSTSYLVDVVFNQAVVPLALVSQSPAAGDPGASLSDAVSATFSAALATGANLTVSAGSTAVAGTVARSTDGRTLAFQPSEDLAPSTVYTAVASGLVSTRGSTLPPVTWTFTTISGAGCPCTLFADEVPAIASVNDPASVELGVAFSPTEHGLVTGVRFYKGVGNAGAHTGTLWSSAGTALRTVTFTDETASGWQTALFATPFEVTPGATYVVSYLAPQGGYSATSFDFTADRVVGPLTVAAAGNGRYAYGGGFPVSTWQATNYFVDVVFARAAPSLPQVVAATPADGTTEVWTGTSVVATLSKAPPAGTPTIALAAAGGVVAGTSTFDAAALTVTFVPDAALPPGEVISAAVSIGGAALEGGAWSFTTVPLGPVALTLWNDTEVPVHESWDDAVPVQVGTSFTASVAGTVSAIRFYKGAANTGAHTVMLWDANGTLLASAPSTAESASGWQTVTLATPVSIGAGTRYVASYHSTTGGYAVTVGELVSARTRGPLSTTAPGGAYVYGTGFPDGTSTAGYGVDLVFTPAP